MSFLSRMRIGNKLNLLTLLTVVALVPKNIWTSPVEASVTRATTGSLTVGTALSTAAEVSGLSAGASSSRRAPTPGSAVTTPAAATASDPC